MPCEYATSAHIQEHVRRLSSHLPTHIIYQLKAKSIYFVVVCMDVSHQDNDKYSEKYFDTTACF